MPEKSPRITTPTSRTSRFRARPRTPLSNSSSSLVMTDGSPSTRAMPSPASVTVPTSSREMSGLYSVTYVWMALRISSAEIVSSAMGGVLFPAGRIWGVDRSVGRSAGQSPFGGFQAVRDAAVDDLVADLDDEAAEHARVHGHLQPDRAAVDPREHAGEPLLLGGGQRHGAGHPGHRLPTPSAGHLGQPLDRPLGISNVRTGEHVPHQLLGHRADPPGEQPVQEGRLALGGRRAVAEDASELVVGADDAAEAEQLVLDL